MKICVLNGSPKGRQSITMQYVRFLELAYPAHTFVIEDVALRTAGPGNRDDDFSRVVSSIASADAVLFASPVYFMLVPAQFKRFIELAFLKNAGPAFAGKYAASLTTSIHFFDHTANAYLHAVAEDLGMHFTGSFMAGMEDLLDERKQEDLVRFAGDFFDAVERKPVLQRTYPPLSPGISPYRPGPVPLPFDTGGKRVVILSDAAPGSNLEKMVTRAASCFGKMASIVPLDEAGIRGGCRGCCRCAFDNTCVYTDGFSTFFEKTLVNADILFFAGPIRDRYLSAQFKQFLDRTFSRGHVPYLAGRQVGFLIEGPLAQCCTLREILSSFTAMQGSNLAGIVSDESPVSAETDARIDALCEHSIRLSRNGYIAPGGFPAVAGHKIFRDEIWGSMRAVFRADDAYYRKHGLYDFPHKDIPRRIRTALLSLFLSIPPVRKRAEPEMEKHMLEPFARVFRESTVLKHQGKKD